MFKKQEPSRVDALDAEVKAARELLLSDPKVLRRKVRRVAIAGDENPYSLALYTVAAGRKFEFTPTDWNLVLDRLDECELTVREWLKGGDDVSD